MSNTQRFRAEYEGRLSELVEGTVTKIDDEKNVMTVKIEETIVSGKLVVEIPIRDSSGTAYPSSVPARPLGHGYSTSANMGTRPVLTGDLRVLPRIRQKVLMHLLFEGTSGFRCLGWTLKDLVVASSLVTTMMYGKVEADTITN